MTVHVAMTGATGFVGRHVAAALAARGFAVRALVRDELKATGIKFAEPVIGSLADDGALDRLVKGADALVHLAGVVAAKDRDGFLKTNRDGTRKLADAAVLAGVKRIVHVSSLAAREPQLSDYAFSKNAGEAIMTEQAGHLPLAILRPPAIYGPGDRATLPLFTQLTRRFALVPGTREQRFSLLYAGDFARLIASLIDSSWSGIAEVDDGKSNGYDWSDLVSTATSIRGRPVKPVFLPQRFLLGLSAAVRSASIPPRGKIRELYHPDWVCRGQQPDLADRTGLAEGFRQTLDWYREEGWLPGKGRADKGRSHHHQKVLAA